MFNAAIKVVSDVFYPKMRWASTPLKIFGRLH